MLDIYMHIINTKLEQILSEYNIEIFHLLSGFLIIDKITVYHIGASLKDLGKKWFAFSKINLDMKELLSKLV